VYRKPIERLMREECPLVRQRPHCKCVAVAGIPTPMHPKEQWSEDSVRDKTLDRRPFRAWTVVDDSTRECP
jgi:hypothetical protein